MNLIYDSLSRMKPVAKSYTFKFLFVAFLGIHIPLIGLIIFIIFAPHSLSALTILLITLGLTLGATAVTLFILNRLLEPLHASKKALASYLSERTLPELPRHYTDEAGILMRQVQETVNSLDLLLEEKKDLIGLLSHDLRTPLATILAVGKQMQRAPQMTNEQRKELAAIITESTTEQLALFRRILEILRNDDIDRLHLKMEEISALTLIENSLKELKLQADQKGLKIELSGQTKQLLFADPMLIAQVFKNLVSNAIKFSHPDSVIRIRVDGAESRTRISVNDAGLGFEPEDAEKLFRRFTDKRKLGTASEASTGMGLYLSRKIVKAHNGSIYAKSEGVNRGACFTMEV